jgi:phosphoribosylcarboxyaminoimidazole (NCAIR) mutase
MPPGVPVATMAVGSAGARNAAFFAAQIIGRKDQGVAKRLKSHKKKMADEVEKKARALQKTDTAP